LARTLVSDTLHEELGAIVLVEELLALDDNWVNSRLCANKKRCCCKKTAHGDECCVRLSKMLEGVGKSLESLE
jgi:hypothetical protein